MATPLPALLEICLRSAPEEPMVFIVIGRCARTAASPGNHNQSPAVHSKVIPPLPFQHEKNCRVLDNDDDIEYPTYTQRLLIRVYA